MFVIGIDIGKDDLYVRLLETAAQGPPTARGQVRVFPNSQAGHQSLRDWLAAEQALPQFTSVVMEATGVYWERVAVALHTAQFAVSVVNAAQIKFFARSTLRRGKTDTMDAEIIARYGVTMHPARWMPTDHSLEELRALIHERDTIVELITTEKGRQHALDHRHRANPVARQLSHDRTTLLNAQLEQINAAISTLTVVPGELQKQLTLLASVPGIGKLTAAILLTETHHLDGLGSARQWAAYAGLSPAPRQSGAMQGKTRISKIGNARLRRALYLSALSASRLDNVLGGFYRHLVNKGKPKKVALIALARKILCVCFAVLRSGRPFDPTYRSSAPQTP